MWIIIVSDNISEIRDNKISSLIGDPYQRNIYVS